MQNLWGGGGRGRGATMTLNLAMAIAFFVPSLKKPIHYFHIPIIHFVYPPKVLQKNCFQFLLGFTILPRELVNNTYAKFWGVNKVGYG